MFFDVVHCFYVFTSTVVAVSKQSKQNLEHIRVHSYCPNIDGNRSIVRKEKSIMVSSFPLCLPIIIFAAVNVVADDAETNVKNDTTTTTASVDLRLLIALVTTTIVLVLTSTTVGTTVIHLFLKTISTIRLQIIIMMIKNRTDDNNHHSTTSISVSDVYIHPVKSMRSISLPKSQIDWKGLIDDRRYMVIYELPLPVYKTEWSSTDVRYRFLTQRQCPSLATIQATFQKKNDEGENEMLMLKQQTNSIQIPLSSTSLRQKYRVGIWDDIVWVEDLGDDVATFVQQIVDSDTECTIDSCRVRLVRQTVDDQRRADDKFVPSYAKTWSGSSPLVSLTDGYPILIANQSSLDELNRRLTKAGKSTIPMSRFRPNIVVQGSNVQPFEEDSWKIISVGTVLFAIVKACPRCKQSCTDQRTGQVHDEPVQTMKSFRALGMESDDVFFAQNAIPLLGPNQIESIQVGDPVRIIERGDPIYM
jgi:uncharacterized protein YcbX